MIRIAPFRTCTRGGRAVNAMEHDCKQDSQEFVVLRRGVAGSGANVFTDPPIVN